MTIGFGLTNGEKWSNEGLMIDAVIRYGKPPCISGRRSLDKEFLCAKTENKTVCSGDSGSLLICGEQQYGITIHTRNLKMAGEAKCGIDTVEDKYLFVYNYKDWISSYIDPPKKEEKSYCPIIKPLVSTMFVAFMLLEKN
uniref:Peptidase S1 domain-containing protein n=1 Tax=Sipha flava TaxID=143950 RepID=A0A2S2Q9V5_9HEMI